MILFFIFRVDIRSQRIEIHRIRYKNRQFTKKKLEMFLVCSIARAAKGEAGAGIEPWTNALEGTRSIRWTTKAMTC